MQISNNLAPIHTYQLKKPESSAVPQPRQTIPQTAVESSQQESNIAGSTGDFISNAMEQLLANKLGINKEKLEELQKEIDELKNIKEPSKEQKERLDSLTEQLEELVRQEAERAAEQEAKRRPDNQLLTYQSIASMTNQ